jgi:hypothetical protein
MAHFPPAPHGGAVSAARLAALVAALLFAPAAGAAGQDGAQEVSVHVTPHVCFEGGAVRTQVRLPRDAANRALRVEVDSGGYYSSSTVQIDGDAAPELHERRWLDLPAGKYMVTVLIVRASGETSGAQTSFTVVDPRTRPTPPNQ